MRFWRRGLRGVTDGGSENSRERALSLNNREFASEREEPHRWNVNRSVHSADDAPQGARGIIGGRP